MKKYGVIISKAAMRDIDDVFYHIADVYQLPLTAVRYREELYNKIFRLSSYGASVAISQSRYIQSLYGPHARHVSFKKMIIIYLVSDDCIFVQRVMAAALVR